MFQCYWLPPPLKMVMTTTSPTGRSDREHPPTDLERLQDTAAPPLHPTPDLRVMTTTDPEDQPQATQQGRIITQDLATKDQGTQVQATRAQDIPDRATRVLDIPDQATKDQDTPAHHTPDKDLVDHLETILDSQTQTILKAPVALQDIPDRGKTILDLDLDLTSELQVTLTAILVVTKVGTTLPFLESPI